MAKLTSQVKGIVRFAKVQSRTDPPIGPKFSARNARNLKAQLRSPGVSKKERKLVAKLTTVDRHILNTNPNRPGWGEIRGVHAAIKNQQRISRQGAGGRHPNQGGMAPSSHTTTSSYKKRT